MSATPTPTIWRELANGTLVELLHDGVAGTTTLAINSADGTSETRDCFELPNGEQLVPYRADNNLLTSGCVALPSAIGSFESQGQLLRKVRAYLNRYVELSPAFEELAAYYILFSWVYDAFNEAPMLRLRGPFGSGKSRGLLAIGSVCYKAFFASGASTVSPIFHILDAFSGTLVLDEADFRHSDSTAELVKILNNGTVRGLPVLRTMTNRHRELHPTAFRVFGPKIIAMREHFQDDALESRCITEEMTCRPLRTDIPLVTPDALRSDSEALRNDLLSWRFAVRRSIAIDSTRAVPDLTPRGNQLALPLLSLVEDEGARVRIGEYLAQGEARAVARYATQPHVAMAGVLDRLFREAKTPHVPVAQLAQKYNETSNEAMPIKSVGHVIRSRLGIETRKSAGVYVIPAHEREKVATLLERYGLAD